MTPPAKQAQYLLTLQEKLELIVKVESGWTQVCVAEHYGIGKATVTDIVNSKAKFLAFKNKGYDFS